MTSEPYSRLATDFTMERKNVFMRRLTRQYSAPNLKYVGVESVAAQLYDSKTVQSWKGR